MRISHNYIYIYISPSSSGCPVAQQRRIHLQCRRRRFDSWVREDPLEKKTASHSDIPAWKTPWKEETCGLQPMGSQRVRHDLVTKQQQTPSWASFPQTKVYYFLSNSCPVYTASPSIIQHAINYYNKFFHLTTYQVVTTETDITNIDFYHRGNYA